MRLHSAIGAGPQHAFERNLIHRDIKPVNLFLTHEIRRQGAGVRSQESGSASLARTADPCLLSPGRIKILDWGLASLRCPKGNTGDSLIENISRSIVGTADYLSPEQARNANAVDIRVLRSPKFEFTAMDREKFFREIQGPTSATINGFCSAAV